MTGWPLVAALLVVPWLLALVVVVGVRRIFAAARRDLRAGPDQGAA